MNILNLSTIQKNTLQENLKTISNNIEFLKNINEEGNLNLKEKLEINDFYNKLKPIIINMYNKNTETKNLFSVIKQQLKHENNKNNIKIYKENEEIFEKNNLEIIKFNRKITNKIYSLNDDFYNKKSNLEKNELDDYFYKRKFKTTKNLGNYNIRVNEKLFILLELLKKNKISFEKNNKKSNLKKKEMNDYDVNYEIEFVETKESVNIEDINISIESINPIEKLKKNMKVIILTSILMIIILTIIIIIFIKKIIK